MIYFLQLIRIKNLCIIALSMYGLGIFFDFLLRDAKNKECLVGGGDFLLLVLLTILIAASGNMINDYLDREADKINRPRKKIAISHFRKKDVLFLYLIFNLIASLIAIYLGINLRSFWLAFIPLLAILLLWYYSVWWKKKLIIGNIIIALLTALVTILVGIYYGNSYYFSEVVLNNAKSGKIMLLITIGCSWFAFLLNWAREIVKDMEDVKGDRLIKARTIPIVYGMKTARNYALFLLWITFSSLVLITIGWWWYNISNNWFLVPLWGGAVFTICILIMMGKPVQVVRLKKVSTGIKLMMLWGVISPIYWCFLI